MHEYKTCTKCGQTKPRTSEFFYRNKKSRDGLRPDCSDCGRARAAVYMEAHRQEARDRVRAWRLQDPEKTRKVRAEYYQRYRSEIRAKWKVDYHADPERFKISGRVRRAREKQVPFERYRFQDVLAKWGSDCHICGLAIDLEAPRQMSTPGWELGLHLDHVIPISKGGPDTLENVKPSHGMCNIKKRDN